MLIPATFLGDLYSIYSLKLPYKNLFFRHTCHKITHIKSFFHILLYGYKNGRYNYTPPDIAHQSLDTYRFQYNVFHYNQSGTQQLFLCRIISVNNLKTMAM